MAADVEHTLVLDQAMSEVFDWSDDHEPVRDALWNYYMEKNGRNTDQTAQDMAPYLTMTDDKVRAEAEQLLKH